MTVEIFWCLSTRMWSSLWGCLQLEVISLLHSEGGFHSCHWRQRRLEGRQLNKVVFCWQLFPPHSPKVEETHNFTDLRQNKNDV